MKYSHTAPERSQARGFTLLELIVSIGLFTIVVTIAMTAYLSLIALDRKARATNDLVTNLSFTIENMSRNIRTGTGYVCGGFGSGPNCWGGTGSNKFSFVDVQNQQTTYLFTAAGAVASCVGTSICNDISATTLTDPRIRITNLRFYTQGVGTGDGLQPRVLFTISGTITPDARATPVTFTIESSATQRLIEL